MAEVRKTIGSHPSRDYSTITLWGADLNDVGIYSVGDDAIGECYNDTVFYESATFGPSNLNSATLTVAVGERHGGTDSIGARISGYNVDSNYGLSIVTDYIFTVEWLIIGNIGSGNESYGIHADVNGDCNLYNLIINYVGGVFFSNSSYGVYAIANGAYTTATINILDCVVYSIHAYDSAHGIRAGSWWSNSCNVNNCTVFAVGAGTVYIDGTAHGYSLVDHTLANYRNLISLINFNNTNAGAVYNYCFSPSTFSNATVGYNMSSDATASGTGSIINQENLPSSQVRMTYDGWLKYGSSAINAGIDLGTSPTNVNIDITGYDRNSGGVDWDMGAHEYVLSEYIGLFIKGYGALNDSVDLYIKGYISESIPLYVYGYGIPTDDIDLYIQGHIVDIGNIDLYTSGYTGDLYKTIFLYTYGLASADNSYVPLTTYGVSTEGASGFSGNIPLIIYDSQTSNQDIILFIKNLQTEVPHNEDLNLFVAGDYSSAVGNIPLYVCQEGVYGDFSLFVKGTGTYIGANVDNDSLPLYIYRPNMSSIIPLILCNSVQADNSYIPLYVNAILGTPTENIDLVIPNVHIVDNSYTTLYMLGTVSSTDNIVLSIPNVHANINDNIPLFISHRGALDNSYITMYIAGAYLDNANLDLVMPNVLAELNGSSILYVHGY